MTAAAVGRIFKELQLPTLEKAASYVWFRHPNTVLSVIPFGSFNSLFDLLEVTHLGGRHGRPVKPQARQAALLRAIVVSDENLFSWYTKMNQWI